MASVRELRRRYWGRAVSATATISLVLQHSNNRALNPIALLRGPFQASFACELRQWAEFAALYRESREAYVAHERAKIELKPLLPEGAREAFEHGVRARRRCAGSPTPHRMGAALTRPSVRAFHPGRHRWGG
jgi:hypothetical protein